TSRSPTLLLSGHCLSTLSWLTFTHQQESGRGLFLDPRCGVGLKELLNAFPASQSHPERATFPLQTQSDVKEGTAGSFSSYPFGNQLYSLGVRRELELIAIGQFTNARLH